MKSLLTRQPCKKKPFNSLDSTPHRKSFLHRQCTGTFSVHSSKACKEKFFSGWNRLHTSSTCARTVITSKHPRPQALSKHPLLFACEFIIRGDISAWLFFRSTSRSFRGSWSNFDSSLFFRCLYFRGWGRFRGRNFCDGLINSREIICIFQKINIFWLGCSYRFFHLTRQGIPHNILFEKIFHQVWRGFNGHLKEIIFWFWRRSII
mmetsp:Transcript_3471/g.21791  ORF Transcript_3471/g.21791 Transcript_3471/m.21791 type:complete len:206 (-) Transcript_3471:437-1054(-)